MESFQNWGVQCTPCTPLTTTLLGEVLYNIQKTSSSHLPTYVFKRYLTCGWISFWERKTIEFINIQLHTVYFLHCMDLRKKSISRFRKKVQVSLHFKVPQGFIIRSNIQIKLQIYSIVEFPTHTHKIGWVLVDSIVISGKRNFFYVLCKLKG